MAHEKVGVRVTVEQIEAIIAAGKFEFVKLGEKTTVGLFRDPNGFEIVASSSCVDPKLYDHMVGVDLCKKKIKDKLWELRGYLLQVLNAPGVPPFSVSTREDPPAPKTVRFIHDPNDACE